MRRTGWIADQNGVRSPAHPAITPLTPLEVLNTRSRPGLQQQSQRSYPDRYSVQRAPPEKADHDGLVLVIGPGDKSSQ